MTFKKDWQKLKSGLEWGLFYGIVTWLAFTAMTNKIPALAIWGMIVSRSAMGVLAAGVIWEKPLWMRALTWAAIGHVPFALLALLSLGGVWDRFFFGWKTGGPLMIVSALIIAVLVELSMRHRDKNEVPSQVE